MIVIQCKEELFHLISSKMLPLVPVLIDEPGGYIDCFDKDWIFMITTPEQFPIIQKIFTKTAKGKYIIGIHSDNPKIIQQNVIDKEKYIFIRQVDDKPEILYAFKSFIRFEEQKDNG